MTGPGSYSTDGEVWYPDGTGAYEGEDSTITYDTDGDQHIEVKDG